MEGVAKDLKSECRRMPYRECTANVGGVVQMESHRGGVSRSPRQWRGDPPRKRALWVLREDEVVHGTKVDPVMTKQGIGGMVFIGMRLPTRISRWRFYPHQL
ncbi:hypothetical protein Acr_08g0012560 [Actinidia rufa]|uniref:Uncharacterized protein n=1 Tax=Actinidia rufa TaxID=165716 RepID=A0A7J0F2H2_9ERIC|nr:hypothetical protein Acr_08g0012560 [Actinidia rufa]